MSDQILSQDEIDALLSAMASGEVDLEEEAPKEAEVISYDLTSQSVTLNSQFHALEEIYEKFVGSLQTSLNTSFKRMMEVKFVSSEMVKYRDFLKAFSAPTGFNIFSMEPLMGLGMLVIEPNLLFSIIDCMFGGDGKPLNKERDFSIVDQTMMKKFATDILSHFAKGWKDVFPVHPRLKKIEIKPDFLHLVAPDDFVIAIAFSISTESFNGNFFFCISYLMLEPIKEKLATTFRREGDSEFIWNVQLQKLLKDTEVSVIAELGQIVQTVGDLLNLQVNDVLKLSAGPEDVISVNVENIPKYVGYPGIVKGNRAVQVSSVVRKDDGK